MIARLRGLLHEKSPERVILDVQGVGYDLRVPLSTYGALPGPGEMVELLVHTQVREDSISLFGFATARERFLFEKMISVSGVGPRTAIALLSGIPPEDLVEAIRLGEVERIRAVPGVGRKTAERLVVDLRDKIESSAEGAAAGSAPAGDGTGIGGAVAKDVLSALINLGYPARDAERAVSAARKAPGANRPAGVGMTPTTFDALLRRALRHVAASR